jgi:hypothetical protein
MANIDLKNDIKQLIALDVQAIASDTTTVGNEIDLAGYESATVILFCGAVAAGDVTLLVQDSDTSGSGFVDVADDFLIGSEVDTNIAAANGIARIGYVGKKRYLKVSAVTANSANLTAGAVAVLGSPRHAVVA